MDSFPGVCSPLSSHDEEIFYNEDVKCWNRLPRELVGGPLLETFKTRLEGALSNVI